MGREEAIAELKKLLKKIENFDQAAAAYTEAEKKYENAKNKKLTRVSSFDELHKEQYIAARTGSEPEYPNGVMQILFPDYMEVNYKRQRRAYIARRQEAEKSYLREYASQRRELEIEDQMEKARAIEVAEAALYAAKIDMDSQQEILSDDPIFSDRLKKKEIVLEMISYLDDRRSDSLKEAVNLYYSQKHDREMEKYAREQLELTKKAEEYARQASHSAKSAVQNADEAAGTVRGLVERISAVEFRVEEAVNKAENAYNRASDANSRADEAYNLASSGYRLSYDQGIAEEDE